MALTERGKAVAAALQAGAKTLEEAGRIADKTVPRNNTTTSSKANSKQSKNAGGVYSSVPSGGKSGSNGGSDSLVDKHVQIEGEAPADAVSKAGEIINGSKTKQQTKPAKPQSMISPELDTITADRSSPKTSDTRDKYKKQLDTLIANEGNVTTIEQADEINSEIKRLKGLIAEEDKKLGNEPMVYESSDRVANIFTGTAKNAGAAYTNALGTWLGNTASVSERLDPDILSSVYAGGDINAMKALEPYMTPDNIAKTARDTREMSDKLKNTADKLATAGQADIAKAKSNLGAGGKFAVDFSSQVLQLGADAGMSLLGVPAVVPLAVRAFGSSAQQARHDGANDDEQLLYGLTRAGTEVLTEKLADGLAGVFGKGAIDNVIEGAVAKLANTDTGRSFIRLLFNSAAEGGEEVISSIADPLAQMIYNDKDLVTTLQAYPEMAGELLYDFLMGAATGAAGGTAAIATGADAQKNDALRTEENPIVSAEANEGINTAGMPTEATTEAPSELNSVASAQEMLESYSAPKAKAIPGRDLLDYVEQGRKQKNTAPIRAESTSINDDPLTHTPEEQKRIEEYKTSTDEGLRETIEKYMSDSNIPFSRHNISSIGERQANDLSNLLGGEYRGFKNAINSDGIKHILNEHGPNGTVNRSMKDLNDIARIGYVLDNYDGVRVATYSSGDRKYSSSFMNKDNSPAPMVVYHKKVNGTYYVVEAVPDTKYKKLWVISAYIDKNGDVTQASDVVNPEDTSKTALASPSPLGEIPHEASIIKEQATVNTNSEDSTMFIGSPKEPPKIMGAEYAERGPERERGYSQSSRNDPTLDAEIRAAIEAEPMLYRQLTNKEVLNRANEIYAGGTQNAAKAVNEAIAQAKAGKKLPIEVVPLAKLVANDLAKEGKIQESQDMLADLASELTYYGRASQAVRILRGAGPATEVKLILKLVDRLNTELTKGQKKKNIGLGRSKTGDIVVSEARLQELATAENAEQHDAAMENIIRDVKDQVPPTVAEKFAALRYVNMLGNIKTQIRNVGGNVLMTAETMAKRRVNAGVESLISMFNKDYEKTTTAGFDRNLFKAGLADADANMGDIKGESKNSDFGPNIRDFKDSRQIFDNKALEGYRKLTNWAMEKGDIAFVRLNYADAFQGYLSAHGVKDISEASPKVLNAARAYAMQEAQEATFRDHNKVSDAVANFGKGHGAGVRVLAEGLMPFRRTPANVAVRGYEYSPIGALVSSGKIAKDLIDGKDVSPERINQLSKGITGSALAATGAVLAAMGRATGGGDDDEELNKFRRDVEGWMPYSVYIDGKYYSISQFAPASIPFVMGVELYNAAQDGIHNGEDLMKIVSALSSPLMEMSMVQGVNDALEGLGAYGEDTNALTKLAVNMGVAYLTQGLTNSLFRQAEQASEEYRQTTYSDPDSKWGAFEPLEYSFSKWAAATPGIDHNQQNWVSPFGHLQDNGSGGERFFNAFINPTYSSEDRSNELTKELSRLYQDNKDVAGFPNVLPTKGSRSMEYTDDTHMTADEYERYSQIRGQTVEGLIQDFMASPEYQFMSDLERAQTIESLKGLGADRALKDVQVANDVPYTGGMDDIAALQDPTSYLAYNKVFSTASGNRDAANWDTMSNMLDNFSDLSDDTRAMLKGGSDHVKALEYAHSMDISPESWYGTYDKGVAAQKELGSEAQTTSALAVGIANADASDEQKLNMLKAQLPLDKNGAVPSIAKRYDVAMQHGISYDDWTAVELLLKDGGSTKKWDIRRAAQDAGIDPNTAQRIYKKLYKDPSYVSQLNEEFLALNPYVADTSPKPSQYDYWQVNRYPLEDEIAQLK